MATNGQQRTTGIQMLFLLGPAIFLVVGGGFLVGAIVAPDGSTTDDGYPLGRFFWLMGAAFGGMGAVWLTLALVGIRYGQRRRAALEARQDHLERQGLRLLAAVVSFDTEGYFNFHNEAWCDLGLEYQVPGAGLRRVSRRIALPQGILELARARRPVPILVDPRAPDDYVFPRSGA